MSVPDGVRMTEFRRDLLVGATAGLAGSLVLAASLQAQGPTSIVAGLTGLGAAGPALAAQLLIAVLLGAGFGVIFRYHPERLLLLNRAGELP